MPPHLWLSEPRTSAISRATRPNIWLGQQAAPGLPVFNELAVVVIDGHVDRGRFDRALQAVIDGTDALRLTVDDEVRPSAVPPARTAHYRSPLVDLSGEPDADAALEEWARDYADLMLDLSGRLFDSTLVRLSDDRWAWALLQHHLVTDATSLTLLVERLSDRYRRLADADDPAPPGYPQLAEYLSWLEEDTSDPGYASTEAFWQERMTEPPPPMVFFDGRSLEQDSRPRRERRRRHPGREDVTPGPGPRRAGRHPPGVRGLLPVQRLRGGAVHPLYRTSGEPRRWIGMPSENRPPEAAGTVGLLMEQDPFTVTVGDGDSFRDVVAKVHREALTVMRHLPYAAGNPGGRLYDVALNVVKDAVGDVAGMRGAHALVPAHVG